MIALKANKNPESMLTEKQTLELYLSTKLNRKVKVIIPTDSSIVVESFRNGTLDLGYLSSTDAARNLDQNTASVLLIHLKNGKPHYDSVWLGRKEGNYQSIEDLRDKPVAFAAGPKTSGFLIPCLDLAGRGLVGSDTSLNDFFSQTIYGTGYTSAVEKVLSGEVEAAAVSDYVFKGTINIFPMNRNPACALFSIRDRFLPTPFACAPLSLQRISRLLKAPFWK